MEQTLRRFTLAGTEDEIKCLADIFKTRGKDLTRHDLYIILSTMDIADGFDEEDFL